MNPRRIIAQFSHLGISIREQDGEIQIQGPEVPIPDSLLEAVRRHRIALAAYLHAEAHWRHVVGEISKFWDALDDIGREPTWFDDYDLVDQVDAALSSDDPASAHQEIDEWMKGWAGHLAMSVPKGTHNNRGDDLNV